MSDQVLERFHRTLIEEIRTQRPEYLLSPFTVAEIYQNLAPYGTHRDRIGVEINGDYEHALLRLLAGEGGYLILDSEAALREIRSELETPNPNTALYREFAAADVRLDRAYLDPASSTVFKAPELVPAFEAEDPAAIARLAPSEKTVSSSIEIVPPGADLFGDAPSDPPAVVRKPPAPSAPRAPLTPEFVDAVPVPSRAEGRPGAAPGAEGAEACPWCSESLPRRAGVNFCPFCGSDLSLVPCRDCSAALELGWRFCASCGTGVEA